MGNEKPRMRRLAWMAYAGTMGMCVVALAVVLLAGSWLRGADGSDYSPDLKAFIGSYFTDWSARNVEAYKAHFHEKARIALVADGAVVQPLDLAPFIAQQTAAHARAKTPMTERMTSFSALQDEAAASVAATWELKTAAGTETGVDRFTVIRDAQGKWKIVSLVFYATAK